MKSTSIKYICGAFLLAVFVVMYLLNRFSPMSADDWHYVFIFGTQEPIDSLRDIAVSQFSHYQHFNGRLWIHSLVQFFDGILGKSVFNPFNALVFVLFLLVIARVVTADKGNHYKVMSVAFALLFFAMPGFEDVFLWLSGSFNYLWAGTALLLFHYLLERETMPRWAYIPLALFGLLCGWSNEAFVIGLAAAYFLYYVVFHRERFRAHRRWMLPAFFVGVALLVFAPASFYRASITGTPSSLSVSLYYMRHIRLIPILVVALLLLVLTRRLKFVDWLKREQVLVMALVVEMAFLMMIGIDATHSRFGIELFALVLLLRLMNWNRLGNGLVTVLNIAVLAVAAYVIPIAKQCYEASQQELAQARDSELVLTRNMVPHRWLHRYILDYSLLKANSEKMYGYDPFLTRYFGHGVFFLPEAFVNDQKVNPANYEGQWRSWGTLPFYAKRVHDNKQKPQTAVLTYDDLRQDGQWLGILNKIRRLKTQVTERGDGLLMVSLDGGDYVLVPRRYPEQDDRLRSIKLDY